MEEPIATPVAPVTPAAPSQQIPPSVMAQMIAQEPAPAAPEARPEPRKPVAGGVLVKYTGEYDNIRVALAGGQVEFLASEDRTAELTPAQLQELEKLPDLEGQLIKLT